VSADLWSQRAQAYVDSPTHREGPDLDLLVAWAEGAVALDVATGGGHVARRLREKGLDVVTVDPAPGMRADATARAEDLPFADDSFDVVACRIAAHHFDDVRAAVREMTRVSRDLVLVVDNVFVGDAVEEAEKLRDPTHVRNYSEEEWRAFFADAGLRVEAVERFEQWIPLEPWLERAGCVGDEADRVRELLSQRTADRDVLLERVAIKGRTPR
jgi:SAM-dependent methyltransferase